MSLASLLEKHYEHWPAGINAPRVRLILPVLTDYRGSEIGSISTSKTNDESIINLVRKQSIPDDVINPFRNSIRGFRLISTKTEHEGGKISFHWTKHPIEFLDDYIEILSGNSLRTKIRKILFFLDGIGLEEKTREKQLETLEEISNQFLTMAIPSYFFDEFVIHNCLRRASIAQLISPLDEDIKSNATFHQKKGNQIYPFQFLNWRTPKVITGLNRDNIKHAFFANNTRLLEKIGVLSFYRGEEFHYLLRAINESRSILKQES